MYGRREGQSVDISTSQFSLRLQTGKNNRRHNSALPVLLSAKRSFDQLTLSASARNKRRGSCSRHCRENAALRAAVTIFDCPLMREHSMTRKVACVENEFLAYSELGQLAWARKVLQGAHVLRNAMGFVAGWLQSWVNPSRDECLGTRIRPLA